jgi:hypothetical protein
MVRFEMPPDPVVNDRFGIKQPAPDKSGRRLRAVNFRQSPDFTPLPPGISDKFSGKSRKSRELFIILRLI